MKRSTRQKAADATLLLAEVPEHKVTCASGKGECCYSDVHDCDAGHHWCSASASVCSECGGFFHCATDASKAGNEKVSAEPQMLFSWPGAAAASQQHQHASLAHASLAPGRCCYSNSGDCDTVRDWCSKGADRCEKCAGTFSNVTVLALADTTLLAEEDSAPVASGLCCYAGHNDCDSGRDWCSKGESHCTVCGGTFQGDGEDAKPSKTSAFLSGSAVAAPIPLVAMLSVSGLSLALALAARVTRRSVAPPTEALG
jgi:hypothetical protein